MQADSQHADDDWEGERTLPSLLRAFLGSQRWFGGKGRQAIDVSLRDHLPLSHAPWPDVLAIVEVTYADAAPDRYGLWLGLREDPGEQAVLGTLADLPGTVVVETAGEPRAMTSLLRYVASGADLPTRAGGRLRFSDVTDDAACILGTEPEVRALAADQSNTSIRIGDRYLLKLIRRLQQGENPELEIGRVLTKGGTLTAMSRLAGAITYVAPDGAFSTLGVLQEWIPNSGDGWSHVVGRLRDHVSRPGSWPTMRDEMVSLGKATASLHHALASSAHLPEFAPEPVTIDHVAAWTAGVVSRAGQALTDLRRFSVRVDDGGRLIAALEFLAAGGVGPLPAVDSSATRFSAIRVHGDYHLGQTLKTAAGFAIVDFEGEPTRSIGERRQKQCALKDVAGMLRSFDYARAVACGPAPGQPEASGTELALGPPFLEGYFEAARPPSALFIPADQSATECWIRFFELEKALYELDYELHNRPDWVSIPAGGIVRLVRGAE